jgi:hypothetical protein
MEDCVGPVDHGGERQLDLIAHCPLSRLCVGMLNAFKTRRRSLRARIVDTEVSFECEVHARVPKGLEPRPLWDLR